MFKELETSLNGSLRSIAESSLLKKLNKKGLSRSDLSDMEFETLLADEIEIVKTDGKKVGTGVGIGIALTILSGGMI
jgi:hypothetical protein